MKRMLSVLIFLFLVVSAQVFASSPLVAVMPFEDSVIESTWEWWQYRTSVLHALQEELIDRLVASGQVRVLERSRLEELMKELRLQHSRYFDPAFAVPIGRLLGAQYLLLGSVTRFEAGRTSYLDVGDVAFKGIGVDLSVRLRIVETETGVIVDSFSTDVSLRSGHVYLFLPVPLSASIRGESLLTVAVRQAADDLSSKVLASLSDIVGR